MFWSVIILIVSLGISVFLLAQLWRVRAAPGGAGLITAILSIVVWTSGYILEIVVPDLPGKLFWAKIEFFGIAFVPVGIFLFSLHYTGRGRWQASRQWLLLALVPSLTIILTLTTESHGLIWNRWVLAGGQAFGPLDLTHGGWFWVHVAYSYILLLMAAFFMLRLVTQSHALYRAQAWLMLVGMAMPWAGNFLYITGLTPLPSLDLTPIAFTIATLMMSIGVLRFGLLDITPVAHEAIMRAMRDGVLVLDQKGRVVEINPAAQEIFKPESGNPIGKPLGDLLPELARLVEATPELVEAAREISLATRAGLRTFSLRVAPVLDRRGQMTGRLMVLTDITELQRAQAQVRLQTTALEAAENGIVITDTRGEILWVNPAFTRLTGYTLAETLGQNPRILKSGHHTANFYAELWNRVLAGQVWRGEVFNRRKDGSDYYEEMTITPVTTAEGALTHFIAIKQDISVRKQAEEALQKAHAAAVEANRLKTQLLANVSHDLRTPLGAVIGFADMLRLGMYGNLTPEQNEAVGEIMDSANQLLLFVNNLIGQAQLETGRIVLKDRPFQASELIDAARSAGSLLTARKGLKFEWEVALDLPQPLQGDAYWLRQIVANLVANACKFTEQGSVKVRLYPRGAAEWALEVADTGVGIAPEAQARVFEAFEQVDGSATRKYGGSGLGLSIVSELTTLMGGKIDLRSAPGQGTTLTVCLPYPRSQEKLS